MDKKCTFIHLKKGCPQLNKTTVLKHYDLIIKIYRLDGGFRFPIMERAWKLGIKGYIKKDGSGRYSIEAEGEEALIADFIEYCKKGPIGSPVSSFQINEGNLVNYDSFDIR
ncbi:MAG: hypothetical protein CVU06_13275 [Bacteroidetes bacterium HGW-Bacteroidetes-22]|nr:MAG: hypothetical protein CVU06_13275 [Bacteroidetes bacterium HGW-Bacteroidetes-22]